MGKINIDWIKQHTHTLTYAHMCTYTPLPSHTATSTASWIFQASHVFLSLIGSPIASPGGTKTQFTYHLSSVKPSLVASLVTSPHRSSVPCCTVGTSPLWHASCVCAAPSRRPMNAELSGARACSYLAPCLCTLTRAKSSKVCLLPRLQPGHPGCDCKPTQFP